MKRRCLGMMLVLIFGLTAPMVGAQESGVASHPMIGENAAEWKKQLKWSIPVLLDRNGEVSASFAPEGVLPDLPRDQIPIASNLIIDREGKIQFYSLLDSRNFDAQLVALKARLDELLEAA